MNFEFQKDPIEGPYRWSCTACFQTFPNFVINGVGGACPSCGNSEFENPERVDPSTYYRRKKKWEAKRK